MENGTRAPTSCGHDPNTNINTIKTRLTYNSAHIRSTKESLTIEYFEEIIFFVVEKKNVEE